MPFGADGGADLAGRHASRSVSGEILRPGGDPALRRAHGRRAGRQVNMMNASHIAAYLREHNICGEVVVLPTHTPTVEEAARAVGTSVEHIVKSLLFLADDPPVLVVATGTARAAFNRMG